MKKSTKWLINRSYQVVFLIIAAILLLNIGAQASVINYPNSWGNAGFTLERESTTEVEVNFSIKEFTLDDIDINGETLQILHLPEVFLPNDTGAPDLPGMGRYIAIPQGASAEVRIIDYRTETLYNIDIAPAFRIPLETEEGPLEYTKNMDIYSTNAYYPSNPIILSEPTQIRGVDVVILGITPFQYNPVTKELIVYRDLRVEVTFDGGNDHFGDDRLRNRWWDPLLNDMLLNYSSLPELEYKYEPSNTDDVEDVEYLIIVPDDPDFIAWADSIKVFRTLQGIPTGVITTTEIGGNTATAIENYINTAYYNVNWDPALVAVLLLGDYGTTGNTIVSPFYSGFVSDHIYADVNNNMMADVILARMTAQNNTHLETMVTKAINYERTPPENPDFYDNPITAMGYQSDRWFQLCSEIINGFWEYGLGKNPVRENAGYTNGQAPPSWSTNQNTWMILDHFGPSGLSYIPSTPSHLTDWGGNATRINNDINSGASIIQHRDHGGETGWSHPSYNISNLYGLHNEDLVFVFSINCLTGKFNWYSECFAEAFHRYTYNGENAGALGIIAASEVSYSFVNDTYVWGMYDNMWPEFMPTFGTTPESRGILPAFGNAAGKYFLQQSNWPYNSNNKAVTYYLFHHHGDAFTSVYTELPQLLTVSHNPVLLSGIDYFDVTADEGSLISLTVDGEIIGIAEGTGLPVSISIVPQEPDNIMLVTITKQNYYRYAQEVEVIPPEGPYILFESYTINDILGNNNGEPDYGEDILLGLTLRNIGLEDGIDVIAILSSADSYITITDDIENFGTVPAEGYATLEDAYAFTIADDVPDQHIAMFDLEVTGTSDETWYSSFNITINAPDFTIGEMIIDDSGGNNNGRLDQGETVNVTIPTTNDGHANSPFATGTLSCYNQYITMNTTTYPLGIITEGATANAIFNFSVSENAPVGLLTEFNYTTTAGNYSNQKTFTKYVGLSVEDFETGNFSNYYWEQGGSENWTVVTQNPYEGIYCAKSGPISHYQTTQISINLDVFAGNISFYRKVSSESGDDYLIFYIDNEQVEQWSGNLSWDEVSYPISLGNHTFTWRYQKDGNTSSGSDCAWIDFIVFPPIVPPDPVFSMIPISLDFGEVVVGEDSTAQFIIYNLGGDTLSGVISTPTGYSVSESGGTPSDNTLSYNIPWGYNQIFDLTFAPTAVQSYNGNVIVTSNGSPNPLEYLAVTGIGVPAPPNESIEGVVTLLTTSPPPGNIEDVVVTTGDITVNPDENGYYQIVISPGIYDVTASLDGYTSVTIDDVVVEENQITSDINMTLVDWDVISGTQYNMVVMATVILDGEYIGGINSNQLAAFGPGGLEDCRSIAQWIPGPNIWYFTVVGNTLGEVIDFKLYETETDSIYNCFPTVVFQDNITIGSSSAPFELTATTMIPQEFSLGEEWNWISFNIHPEDVSIVSVFEPLTPYDIYQVKNQNQSSTYSPDWGWLGDLIEIADGEGYLVDMNNAVSSFIVSGILIDPSTPIDLVIDWNWIGYYPDYILPLEEAMASIVPNVYQVKNQTQSSTYNPDWGWLGDLTQMEPCIGYKLFMNASDVLIYPEPTDFVVKNTPNNPSDREVISGTQYNMVLMAQVKVDNRLLNGTDENKIMAFGPGGETDCRAIGAWIEGPDIWYFTVVGNENGEEISFKIYEDDIVYDSKTKIIFEDNSTIGNTRNLYLIENKVVIENTKLKTNFPNPFSNSTTISFNLKEESHITLSVYNVKGELVETLIDAEMDAGNNHQIIWNGRSVDKNLANGIYFYKLSTNEKTFIKKMILLR